MEHHAQLDIAWGHVCEIYTGGVMPGKGIGLSAIAVGMAVKRAKEGRYSGGLGLQKKQRCRERKKKKIRGESRRDAHKRDWKANIFASVTKPTSSEDQ